MTIDSALGRKLGFKRGMTVCLVDAPQQGSGQIRSVALPEMTFSERLADGPFDLVFFWPLDGDGLAERFVELQRHIAAMGAIWAIIPKRRFATEKGSSLTWEKLQHAALQTDLVDNKTASVSDEEYGTRFVIRRSRRAPRIAGRTPVASGSHRPEGAGFATEPLGVAPPST